MESDHASKVKEARDARRKRILAKSSERLAYITQDTPLSSPSASFREYDLNLEARKSDVMRSLGFQKKSNESSDHSGNKISDDTFAIRNCVGETDLKHAPTECTQDSCGSEPKDSCNSEEKETSKLWLAPSDNGCSATVRALVPATTPQPRQYSSTFLDNLNRAIHDSLLSRVTCTACIAILFVSAATLLTCGHPWGITLNLYTPFWPIALVFAMDFVLVLGALLVSPCTGEIQLKKLGRGSLEQTTKTINRRMWDIVVVLTEVIVAISLDCGIYLSLQGGGLLLARYYLSSSCSFNRA